MVVDAARGWVRTTLLMALVAVCTACHGRPLQSQMAPGSDPRVTGAKAGSREARGIDRRALDRYSRARDLFEGRTPLSPVENRMTARDYRVLADAQRRRDPRVSNPPPRTGVRKAFDEALANPAQPSFMDPAKAYMPGELCADPIVMAMLFIQSVVDPKSLERRMEAWRKERKAER